MEDRPEQNVVGIVEVKKYGPKDFAPFRTYAVASPVDPAVEEYTQALAALTDSFLGEDPRITMNGIVLAHMSFLASNIAARVEEDERERWVGQCVRSLRDLVAMFTTAEPFRAVRSGREPHAHGDGGYAAGPKWGP